jgi:hypothetical protein
MDPARFSQWKSWQARGTLDRLHLPGVYALVISGDDLSDKTFTWLPQIVYFGMTNAVSGLKGRLKQFDNTINGKTGHGGAERFCRDFPHASDLLSQLYVAVLPFECKVTSNCAADLLIMGTIVKAEYECFAQFAELFDRLPKYNDKKNSPKYGKRVVSNDG